MDEEETKSCPNCKREIPAVNFTIHSVHCARNIRVCPVCKEPVPSSELDQHHQKFHKLLPCKQCGESVCGTDLEDHIRDSCANTIKTCRYCELELPRRELPAHEGYCGVRTDQCPDCKEFVMIKYRQLHLDSNHGFIRLDDDPAPVKKEPLKLTRPAQLASTSTAAFGAGPPNNITNTVKNLPVHRPNSITAPDIVHDTANRAPASNASAAPAPAPVRPTSIFDESGPTNFRNDFPRLQSRQAGAINSGSSASSSGASSQNSADGRRPITNGVKKRTNDQPQINTHKETANKLHKDLGISRGAVKKRPAPPPPRAAPPPRDPRRDMSFYSAMQRQQREERERREQNEYNLAHGLPPVLNPAAKLEKLRKMDALHNREIEEDYRDQLRRRSPEVRGDEGRTLQDFKNLKPMSPEQFMARFSELQLSGGAVGGGGSAGSVGGGAGAGSGRGAGGGDRFREIKSSLRELRRGLNEVTAPYNNNNINANNNNDRMPVSARSPAEELRLPCEFCNMLVPADDLVQHQTGCRPDLAQWWGGRVASPPRSPEPACPRVAAPRADPVIPCEFCAESLPVYLITEHQEQCAREVDILSAD